MIGLAGMGLDFLTGSVFGGDKFKSLGAGLLNSTGDALGMGLSNLFGMGGGSMAESQTEALGDLQEKALQNDLKYQEAKNLASQTNSLGLTGQAAALDAQRAMDQTGPTSQAISAANNMNAQAQSGISGAGSQANIAKITGQQATANIMNEARGMSGNPAAAMAMMNKIGQQAGQNGLNALSASNDAIAKANSQAIGASAQGANLMDESAKTNFSTNIAPHLTQTNANLNTAGATIGGGASSVSSSAGGGGLITNPLENLASMYQGDASGARAAERAYGTSLMANDASKYILPGVTPEQSGNQSNSQGSPLMMTPPPQPTLMGGIVDQNYINKRYGGYNFLPSN